MEPRKLRIEKKAFEKHIDGGKFIVTYEGGSRSEYIWGTQKARPSHLNSWAEVTEYFTYISPENPYDARKRMIAESLEKLEEGLYNHLQTSEFDRVRSLSEHRFEKEVDSIDLSEEFS